MLLFLHGTSMSVKICETDFGIGLLPDATCNLKITRHRIIAILSQFNTLKARSKNSFAVFHDSIITFLSAFVNSFKIIHMG